MSFPESITVRQMHPGAIGHLVRTAATPGGIA
jgi:hypothetical protein